MKYGWAQLDATDDWTELRRTVEALETRTASGNHVAGFPALYRRCCAQLAIARQRHHSVTVCEPLEELTSRGHRLLYGDRIRSRRQIIGFLTGGFPRLVRRYRNLVVISALLFYLPLLATLALVWSQPHILPSFLSAETVAKLERMYGLEEREPRSRGVHVLMFGHYVHNNVSIGFRTYAWGLLGGIGAAAVLIFNGLQIGAVLGHLTASGMGVALTSFVVGHGAFELTALVIFGAAGLRLGLALLAPGRLPRSRALVVAGRDSVQLVAGATVLMIVAAGIEAFWSPSASLGVGFKYLFGTLAWASVGGYLTLAGRSSAP